MTWQKLGRVWDPVDAPDWAASHAAMPIAVVLDDRVRVIHTVRDALGRSMGSWFDFVPGESGVLRYADHPSLVPGRTGFFDDSGAMPSTVWMEGGELQCLYVGWNLAHPVPFRHAIGHATSSDLGSTFVRSSNGPVMDRTRMDPAFVTAPFVLESEPRRLWYVSCIEWVEVGRELRHRYHIRHARRVGPAAWEPDGTICIDFDSEEEYAISRPAVERSGAGYRMWFSSRGSSYRVRTATSADGLTWRRQTGISLDVAEDGFDSEMTAYPSTFVWQGRRYMLYNGNDYGRSGIGLAVESPQGPGDAGP